jgi:hypothetical protein
MLLLSHTQLSLEEFTSAHLAKSTALLATTHQLNCTICGEALTDFATVRRFLLQTEQDSLASAATSQHGIMPLYDVHRCVTLHVPLQTILKLAEYNQWVSS